MTQVRLPKRKFPLWLALALLVAALLLGSSLIAGGAGRLLGELWVTTMAAVMGLFGGLFAS